jgi:hypothetical protein
MALKLVHHSTPVEYDRAAVSRLADPLLFRTSQSIRGRNRLHALTSAHIHFQIAPFRIDAPHFDETPSD